MTVRFLAERLRQLRERHRLTQEQFAEVAEVGYKFYQQIESGRKKQLWLETVERLAAGFGLEAWQLLAPELPAQTSLTRMPSVRHARQPEALVISYPEHPETRPLAVAESRQAEPLRRKSKAKGKRRKS